MSSQSSRQLRRTYAQIILGLWTIQACLLRRNSPLTRRALLATMSYFIRRLPSRQLYSYLVVTPDQIRSFLKGSWDYTERRLAYLQEVSSFPLNKDGVVQLAGLYKTMQALDGASFDRLVAQIYEHATFPVFQHIGQAFRNPVTGRHSFVMDCLAALPSPPERFCDVGCGAGILLGDVLERYPTLQGVGLDISHAVLAHASEVLKVRSLAKRTTLIQANMSKTPLPTGHFDFIIALEVLEHQPDPGPAIAELERILKPNGFLVTTAPLNNPTSLHVHVFPKLEDYTRMHVQAGLQVRNQKTFTVAPGVLNALLLLQK